LVVTVSPFGDALSRRRVLAEVETSDARGTSDASQPPGKATNAGRASSNDDDTCDDSPQRHARSFRRQPRRSRLSGVWLYGRQPTVKLAGKIRRERREMSVTKPVGPYAKHYDLLVQTIAGAISAARQMGFDVEAIITDARETAWVQPGD
jgi:hypothetical protein